MWLLGEHRLVCGDATDRATLDRAMGGARADLVWTDPPYGVDYVGKTREALTISGDTSGGLQELLRASFAEIDRVCRDGAAIYVAHAGQTAQVFLEAFADIGWRLRQTLVWVKDRPVLGHGDYHYQHEPILYGVIRPEGRWGRGGDAVQLHPFRRPVRAANLQRDRIDEQGDGSSLRERRRSRSRLRSKEKSSHDQSEAGVGARDAPRHRITGTCS